MVKKGIFSILIFCSITFAEEDFLGRLGEQKEIKEITTEDPIILSFGKNLEILNDLMSKIISRDQLFNIPMEKPVSIPKWKPFPGRFSQIEQGADQTTFGINSKNEIFLLKNEKWLRYPGKVRNLCLTDAKNVWGVGERGQIYRLDFSKSKWIKIRGKAKYISCGFDGTIMAIYSDADALKYQLPIGSLIRLEKGQWLNFPGQLEKVSVASKNDVWGIKKSGAVWHFDGESWVKMPGEMAYISVAQDKTVVAVGINGGAYIWSGKEWINVPGINLTVIKVPKNGSYMGLTSDGSVWKSEVSAKDTN